MSEPYKLSLSSAIMINMNIMLGAGIFLNPVVLSIYAGAVSPLSYLIVGVLMLPLILSITYLLQWVPGGSFFDFGCQINRFTGFVTAWSYFIGKLASGALMLHFGFSLIQELIPGLQAIDILRLDFIGIVVFAALNLFGLKTGTHIQMFFMVLKIIPIIAIIFGGFVSYNASNFAPVFINWEGIPLTIPLVLYAFTGFEASCSLYRRIVDPKTNAPRSVLIAFLGTLCLAILFQLAFYAVISRELLYTTPYFEGLALYLDSVHWQVPGKNVILWAFQLAIALSALGGSYAVLLSVNWNLYHLATEKLTFFSGWLSKLNRYHIAWMCVVAEALIYMGYLFTTQGYQIPLQQIAALGCTVSYSLCVIALIWDIVKTRKVRSLIAVIAVLGLTSCSFLLLAIVQGFFEHSILPLISYFGLMLIGISMYAAQRVKNKKKLT